MQSYYNICYRSNYRFLSAIEKEVFFFFCNAIREQGSARARAMKAKGYFVPKNTPKSDRTLIKSPNRKKTHTVHANSNFYEKVYGSDQVTIKATFCSAENSGSFVAKSKYQCKKKKTKKKRNPFQRAYLRRMCLYVYLERVAMSTARRKSTTRGMEAETR